MTYIGELQAAWHRPYNTTIFESENLWGFNIRGEVHRNISQIYSNFDIYLNISADYTIEDGVLAHYSAELTNLTSGTYYQYVSANRIGLDMEDMEIVTTYLANRTPVVTPTEPTDSTTTTTTLDSTSSVDTLPEGLTSINPYVGVLNTVAVLVWTVVIVIILLDYRRRKSQMGIS
jgi:hypothetical protein